MTNVDMTRFDQLLADKKFVEQMLAQQTAEDVQKLFNDTGVDFTLEDVNEIGEQLNRAANSNEELSEEALEDVSGGFAITVAGVIAAGKIIVAVGGAGLAVWGWYRSR